MSMHKGLRAKIEGRGRILAAGVGVAAVLALVATGAAVGDGERQIGSPGIKDNSLRSPDYRDGSVHAPDLANPLENRVNVGRVTRLESDGPYPGATDLGSLPGQGDNSDAKVGAGEHATVWVQCAGNKLALGGGYRLAADNTVAAAEAIHVIASEPTQIADGEVVYDPIAGDDAGSFRPNGWLVEVVNSGDSVQVVRPWVVCANVSR